ncbi:hypothetical protein ZHAS_00018369 [Anopheles sinensis]|uniref:Uncharacterized protein n=1 Tax=Anopheles sinensis TaxID=74873 RepID=A0A084WHM3_ANOSI|nr:hypothetical protein ZHAS_00018369 [Anopheles sinensis]
MLNNTLEACLPTLSYHLTHIVPTHSLTHEKCIEDTQRRGPGFDEFAGTGFGVPFAEERFGTLLAGAVRNSCRPSLQFEFDRGAKRTHISQSVSISEESYK